MNNKITKFGNDFEVEIPIEEIVVTFEEIKVENGTNKSE